MQTIHLSGLHFTRTQYWLTLAAALPLLGVASSAQSHQSGKVFARYNKPLKSATLDMDTGTISRGPRVTNRKGTTVSDFDNNDLGGFVGVDSGNGFCKWIDSAVKGTGAGRTAGVVNVSDLMNSIVFAYCSAKLTPGSTGPGGTIALHFYEGYTLFGGAPTTQVAAFTLSGLPGNSASSSFFGGFACFFLEVQFAQLVSFADGPIGYGVKFLDQGTGTINPLGAVVAGTWPFLSCTVSCSASVLQTDLQGMTDAIDEYCPPGTLLATFTFGTTSGSFTSISMSVEEVVDQTATITVNPGIPAAPDLLRSSAAVAGGSWTATVTSGFARTKAGSWTLFFGSAGVALPTGFDITQFPKGGGNFGTNKAGRRLLCNINAANPSGGCAGIALPAGLGSSSACSAVIPKNIGLVCNVWCGQAVVVGTVPAGCSGGGNTRLTNSINWVIGTIDPSSIPPPPPPPPPCPPPAPVAEFVGSPLSGAWPLTVNFTNQSAGSITSHAWTFGDGGISTAASPSHIYAAAGTYTVALTETGPGGSNTRTRLNYIIVNTAPPVAQFVGNPLSGVVPLTVNFTNQSTGSITSHAWTFGDGGTSTAPSPSHIYAAVGTYTVALTETGPLGSNTRTRPGYITVTSAVAPGTETTPLATPTTASCGTSDTPHTSALDPVNLFSGEFYEDFMDLRIPGRGLDFVWGRKYRSKIGPSTELGHGWEWSYNVRLEQSSGNLVLHDGGSRSDTYSETSPGTWTRPEFFREITSDGMGGYKVTFPDKGMWQFFAFDSTPKQGKLKAIVDRNGNILSFAYDGLGRLATITDTLGRLINVASNGQGLIASVTDFTGRQVLYSYYQTGELGGSPGDLKSVTRPAVTGTPNGNDFPAGKTTVYTYSRGFSDERLNHNLLSVTDPKGQTYVTNVYAATQDSGTFDFDRLVRQTWGAPGDIIDLVYVPQTPSGPNSNAVIKTILSDRLGHVKEYSYDAGNRLVLRREYTGIAPDPDGPTTETVNRPAGKLRATDPDFFEMRWEYNADGLETRIVHPNLNEELFFYDVGNADPRAQGNLLEHRWLSGPLGGDQAQISEFFEYDSGFGGCCGTNFVIRQVDGRGNETLHEYDLDGNRIHTTHRIPSVVEDWEYNAAGQMTAHILPDNGSAHRRRDEFTYYSSGAQTGYLKDQVVDATGFALTTTYEYDSLGRRERVIDPRGNDTLVIYNGLNQVVRERSRQVTPGGVRYERDLFYDANDNLARIDVQNVDDQQQVVGSNPHLTTIHDFDVLNRTTRTCQEKGSHAALATQLTCAGLPASEFITTEYAYDANRNRTLVRLGEATNGNQLANVVATLYDERDLVFRRTRGAGSATPSTDQHDYDGNGNGQREHEGLEDGAHVTTTDYDGYDRATSRTDPMGNVESWHYDANGNRTSTRTDGELIDAVGNAANVRLAETSYTYDALDRIATTDVAFFNAATGTPIGDGHSITQAAYSENSQVTQVTNDNGHSRLTAYDTTNRVLLTTDAKGNTVAYAFDGNSNAVTMTETEKSDLGAPDQVFVTTTEYDNLDRATQTTDNVGSVTQTLYDSRDNRTRTIDALNHEVRYVYDGAIRQVQAIRDMNGNGASAGDAADIVTAQAWDDSSRLVGQTDDNGNTTLTLFDALNRRVGEQYADGTAQSFTLDGHGSTIQSTDANGSVVTSTYDTLDRLLQKSIVPGLGVSNDTTFEAFQYDGLSRLIRAQDDDSLVTRGYNSMSQVTRETLNGKTTNCIYDGEGNELSSVYPGGRTVTCTYDALERKDTISDQNGLIAAYSYRGPSRVERRDYGNGTRAAYVYDGILPNPANDFGVKQIVRTTHSVISSGAIIDDRTYTWDRMDNKTRRADVRSAGPMLVHDYTLDAAYRLIQSVRTPPGGAGGTTTYALDGVGNRTSVTGGSNAGFYTMSTVLPADRQVNQYTSTPGGARSYDRQGNLVASRQGSMAVAYSYDYRKQMVSLPPAIHNELTGEIRSTVGVRYRYDALGRRIAKVFIPALSDVAVGEIVYFYQGWQVIEERNETDATEATYVHGNYIDEVLTMRRGGGDYYYCTDDNYNVMAVTDVTAGCVERYEYDDFGAPSFFGSQSNPRQASAIRNVSLFTGRQYDTESRLYEYRTRYMEPLTGRFATRDTIGIWGDVSSVGNGYTLVTSNPYSAVDPYGLYTASYSGKNVTITCGDGKTVITKTVDEVASGVSSMDALLNGKNHALDKYFSGLCKGFGGIAFGQDRGLLHAPLGNSRVLAHLGVTGMALCGSDPDDDCSRACDGDVYSWHPCTCKIPGGGTCTPDDLGFF